MEQTLITRNKLRTLLKASPISEKSIEKREIEDSER